MGTAVTSSSGSRGSLGGAAQTAFRQVAGVGEAGGLAGNDADSRAPVAPARHLLHAAVVEGGRRRPLVLRVHLRELAAGTQRRRQHSLEDVLIDHLGHATGEAAWRPAGVGVDSVAVETGLRGEAKLTVGEADTARSGYGHGGCARNAEDRRAV